MSIVARFGGECSLCGERYGPGVRIGRWLGDEVHFACRQEEMARRSAAGQTEALPEARGWADKPQYMKPRRGRGVPYVPEKKYLDGRDSHGRFTDQSD